MSALTSTSPPTPSHTHTYASLYANILHLSKTLPDLTSSSPGDRVLLVYTPSTSFILAFLALLHCSLVPVPVFPPNPLNVKTDVDAFDNIITSSGAKVALTNSSYDKARTLGKIKGALKGSPGFKGERRVSWYNTDLLSPPPSPPLPLGDDDDAAAEDRDAGLCFLQYTSGSTSAPKGVRITLPSLHHNLSAISSCLSTSPSTVEVSWLPQYHDMGLIGSYLGLLWCGGSGHYTSPVTFIKDPLSVMRLCSG
ncbi:hypothetical protein TrRE_jg6992, partial [Triparma retinervis]